MVALDAPRALTAQERGLVAFLAEGPGGCEELVRQAAGARVVAVCDCGCPSIGLEVDGPPVPPTLAIEREPLGRPDYFSLGAVGRNAAGTDVEVILHVGDGRARELEIWTGTWGAPPQTELPPLESLRLHR